MNDDVWLLGFCVKLFPHTERQRGRGYRGINYGFGTYGRTQNKASEQVRKEERKRKVKR